jgi:hypothetical protein
MKTAGPGDRVRVTQTVYRNPATQTGIMARPGDIAIIAEWVNAGTMRARLESDDSELLLRSVECVPL